MNNASAKRRLLFVLLLVFIAFLAWFLFQMNPNVRFRQFKKTITQSYQSEITALSDKKYILNMQEPKILRAERYFYEYYRMNMRPSSPKGLNERNKAEWYRLKKQMEDRLLEIKQLRSDPSLYNLGGAIKSTLVRKNQSSEEKWQRLEQQLREAPWYYTVAKDNLVYPNIEKSKLAIDKQLLTLHFLQSELMDSLSRSHLPEPQRQSIVQQNTQAQLAVKDYLAFCRSLQFESQDSLYSKD